MLFHSGIIVAVGNDARDSCFFNIQTKSFLSNRTDPKVWIAGGWSMPAGDSRVGLAFSAVTECLRSSVSFRGKVGFGSWFHSCFLPWLWACGQAEQHGTVCSEAKQHISQHPGSEEKERSQYLLLGICRRPTYSSVPSWLCYQTGTKPSVPGPSEHILDPNIIRILLSREESYSRKRCSLEKMNCETAQALQKGAQSWQQAENSLRIAVP